MRVWLLVERQLSNMPRKSVKRACELLVAEARRGHLARAHARVGELTRAEAAAAPGVMAAKFEAAQAAGDLKWSEALWLRDVLQKTVDRRTTHAARLRNLYVAAAVVRREHPNAVTFLDRVLEVAPNK